ncbi:MAG: hypothetical protein OXC03_04325 [Flavobacteriaceae bacterium]|nr:hypothetical protein [Flavobacteriaceae bacterium]
MKKTITHNAYTKANFRLEELLKIVGNDSPKDSPEMKELLEVSDVIEKYEEIHFPMDLPSQYSY